MVAWNPDIPDVNIPYYGRLSQPISQPLSRQYAADTSKGQLLKGIGDVVEVGAKVADTLERDYIRKRARDVFQPEVDSEIKAMEGLAAGVKPAAGLSQGDAESEAGGGTQESLANAHAEASPNELPDTAKKGVEKIAQIQRGQDAGKYDLAAAAGRKYAMAQMLRSQTPPGYWDVLDENVREVTKGDSTANAYMAALKGKINAAASAQTKEQQKLETEAYQNYKIDGVAQDHQLYLDGKIDGREFRKRLGEKQVEYNRANVVKNSFETNDYIAKDQALTAERELTRYASSIAPMHMNNVMTIAGLNPDKPEDWAKMGDKIKEIDPKISGQILAGIESNQEQIRAKLVAKSLEPIKMKDGTISNYATMNPKGVDNAMATGPNQLMTGWANFIRNKDVGPLEATNRTIKEIKEARELNYIKSPQGQAGYQVMENRKVLGDKVTDNFLMTEENRKFFTRGLEGTLKDLKAQQILNTPDPRTGAPPTLKSSAEHVSTVPGEDGQGVLSLVSWAHNLPTYGSTPEEIAQKKKMVNWTFSPQNAGFIHSLEESDPSGKSSSYAFRQLYDKPMTEAVHALGPQEWKTYSTSAKDTFQNEVFGDRIHELNQVVDDPVHKATLSWNDHDGKFAPTLDVKVKGQETPYTRHIRDRVTRMNEAIENMHHIFTYEGGDSSTKIYGMLQNLGLHQSPAGAAIRASQTPPEPTPGQE